MLVMRRGMVLPREKGARVKFTLGMIWKYKSCIIFTGLEEMVELGVLETSPKRVKFT